MKNLNEDIINLGVIFGGKSEEHEISILSAASFVSNVDKKIFNLIPIYIDKEGEWHRLDTNHIMHMKTLKDIDIDKILNESKKINISDLKSMINFAFPLVHGKYGEDGTLQGLFEIVGIPYAGCGVLASALAMDKVYAKMLLEANSVPVVEYEVVHSTDKDYKSALNFPVFVKPANSGSSVGIGKAQNGEELKKAIKEALKYDSKVLIERAIVGRELETAIIGNNERNILTGTVGEIIPKHDFYDYDSKYQDSGAQLDIPAKIDGSMSDKIKALAIEAYKALGCTGFARVDCFAEKNTGNIYINEINTIPGFTKYSMFPSLFKEQGTEYRELVEKIVRLGYER